MALCLDPGLEAGSVRELDFSKLGPTKLSAEKSQEPNDEEGAEPSASMLAPIQVEVVLADLPGDLRADWLERLEVWANGDLQEAAADPTDFQTEDAEWVLRLGLRATGIPR